MGHMVGQNQPEEKTRASHQRIDCVSIPLSFNDWGTDSVPIDGWVECRLRRQRILVIPSFPPRYSLAFLEPNGDCMPACTACNASGNAVAVSEAARYWASASSRFPFKSSSRPR